MKILKKVAAFALLAAFFTQNLVAQTAKDADAAFQLGMLDKATTIYESLVKTTPTDPNFGLQLGNLYLAQGKTDKALAAFTAAAAAKPDDKLVNVANARIALINGKTEESVKLNNAAIKSAKKNANIMRQAGESFFFGKTKNLKRAAEILTEANAVNTKDFNTLMSLGWVWKELIDGGKAVTYYDFASSLEPTNPVPVFRIGQVYKQSRNFSKYIEYLKKSMEIDPNFTIAARDLGDYYYTAKKMAEAKTMYDKFISAGKNITIEDRMQYANILFLTKDYDKLVPYVEDVIKTDGSRNYLRRLLGYAAYETNDYVGIFHESKARKRHFGRL
jgi:tetratricopeptide (TPR) repeat protein